MLKIGAKMLKVDGKIIKVIANIRNWNVKY